MPTNDNQADVSTPRFQLGGWRWFVLYAVSAMVIQWPLVGSITTHISCGHEFESTVPLLNLWTVWWNADRAWYGFRGYWDAPIFYPTRNTFVFSEAQPTSLVVAPLLWITGNRGLAYNVYQLLILALNGYSAHRLFRRLGHLPWLAFCGGVMSQILPFVLWQFGVVQLTALFGIYWTIHAVLDLFHVARNDPYVGSTARATTDVSSASEQRDGRSWWLPVCGIQLGLAYGVTYWLCNYWGLFLTALLIPCSVCFWNRQLFTRSFWMNVGSAAMIAGLMIGPFAWMQHSLAAEHAWQVARTDDMILGLSARWRDHTDVPWNTWVWWLEYPEADRNNGWALGGGGLKLLLVPVGIVAACLTRQRRRWGLFAFLFGLIAFGLSLGPTVRISEHVPVIGQVCPYRLMQDYVPGFALIRSPFRFAVFVQIAAVWLSIEALDLLNPARWGFSGAGYDVFAMLRHRQWRPLLMWVPLILVSTLVPSEAVPPKSRLYALPSSNGLPVWVAWLRDTAEPQTAVACFPFPRGSQVGDYEETTFWMYWGTFHGKPLMNGYSGFFPQTYNELRDDLIQFKRPEKLAAGAVFAPTFRDYAWDNPGLKRLNDSAVRYIVLKRSFGTPDDVRSHPQSRFRWSLVLSDELEKVDIYELPSQAD